LRNDVAAAAAAAAAAAENGRVPGPNLIAAPDARTRSDRSSPQHPIARHWTQGGQHPDASMPSAAMPPPDSRQAPVSARPHRWRQGIDAILIWCPKRDKDRTPFSVLDGYQVRMRCNASLIALSRG
jgi:hypothetical protein